MITETSVYLTDEQRKQLKSLISAGSTKARVQTRARILLMLDRNSGCERTDQEAADAVLCSKNTVYNIRRRFVAEGLDVALTEKARPGAVPKVDAAAEAGLSLIACSDPPEGRKRWTLRLIASKAVELGLVESISHQTVGVRLKQTL
jgi:putative transposase